MDETLGSERTRGRERLQVGERRTRARRRGAAEPAARWDAFSHPDLEGLENPRRRPEGVDYDSRGVLGELRREACGANAFHRQRVFVRGADRDLVTRTMDREGEDVEARADVRDRRRRAAPHPPVAHSTASTAGNRWEQVDGRIPGNRRVETPKIPRVLAVHVDIHETLQRPVTLKDPLLERLPVSIRHEVEEAAEGPFELDLNLPFARDSATVSGFRTGLGRPSGDSKPWTIGAHPAAWVPTRRGGSATSPSSRSSRNPFSSDVRRRPEPNGTTMTSGRSKPSCSQVSKSKVFDPSA